MAFSLALCFLRSVPFAYRGLTITIPPDILPHNKAAPIGAAR